MANPLLNGWFKPGSLLAGITEVCICLESQLRHLFNIPARYEIWIVRYRLSHLYRTPEPTRFGRIGILQAVWVRSAGRTAC